MSKGYLPSDEAKLYTWLVNFNDVVSTVGATYGLTPAQVTALSNVINSWLGAYTAHVTATDAAKSARAAKQASRANMLDLLRPAVRQLQAAPNMTDAERQAMGITLRDITPSPAPAILAPPLGRVDTSQRLAHTLKVVDSTRPGSRAKPTGTVGCQVWMKIGGTPPADPSEMQLAGVPSSYKFEQTFDGADGGKPAHYMLRWIQRNGQVSPWSETLTATIAA